MIKQAKKQEYYEINRQVTNESQIDFTIEEDDMEKRLEEFVYIVLQSGMQNSTIEWTNEKVAKLTKNVI